MSIIWRPFEIPAAGSSTSGSTGHKKERMSIKVGEEESKLVMHGYLQRSNNGWGAVLAEVKKNITKSPVNPRLVDYYITSDETISTRRIKRIIRQQQQKQAEVYRNFHSKNSNSLVPQVQTNAILESDASETEEIEVKESVSLVKKTMEYARKRSPEERKNNKLKAFADSDVSTDEERPAKKKQKSIKEATFEAQQAHTKMCEQASSVMSMMPDILKKLEKKLDEL